MSLTDDMKAKAYEAADVAGEMVDDAKSQGDIVKHRVGGEVDKAKGEAKIKASKARDDASAEDK